MNGSCNLFVICQQVENNIETLNTNYNQKLTQKEELSNKSRELEKKLERAGKLVSGLGGERERWEGSVAILEENIEYLLGDCLIAAAFLSYVGPFLSNYRDELVKNIWLPQVHKLGISCNPEFSFATFMAKPTQV